MSELDPWRTVDHASRALLRLTLPIALATVACTRGTGVTPFPETTSTPQTVVPGESEPQQPSAVSEPQPYLWAFPAPGQSFVDSVQFGVTVARSVASAHQIAEMQVVVSPEGENLWTLACRDADPEPVTDQTVFLYQCGFDRWSVSPHFPAGRSVALFTIVHTDSTSSVMPDGPRYFSLHDGLGFGNPISSEEFDIMSEAVIR